MKTARSAGAAPVQQKSRTFNPASLPHPTQRTTLNLNDALIIPEPEFPACHQLWGQPDDLVSCSRLDYLRER